MRSAAPLAVSGLIALILAELVKLVLPSLAGWVGGILLVVLKALVVITGVSIAIVAIAAPFFLGRWMLKRRDAFD